MKLKYIFALSFFFLLSVLSLSAQNTAFGVKGGLTVGIQDWNGFEQDPLLKYHGILFVESAPEDNAFALFAQLGYHVKGSAIRNRFARNFINNQINRIPPREFQFRNISLTLGGKQKYQVGLNTRTYYMIGVRGDYTINTNLKQYELFGQQFGTLIYPFDQFVQKFNYGATLGGGLEFPFSEFIAGVLELTINPDFSYQYRQPRIEAVYNPYTGNNSTISERLIRNVAIEVTLGMRFLHKVVYID